MESALFNILHEGIQIKHNRFHTGTKTMQKNHLAQYFFTKLPPSPYKRARV